MRYLSLCSGIEAATVAWAPLGWTPVAFADTDHYCRAFLEHRWPDVPNLGDVAVITDEQLEALGPIDLVVGGTPCQDLSVAGQRRGMAGARSGLFFDYVRVFDAARRLCGARFALWENVPGALSNRRGRDFAVVVSEFTGCEFEPPNDGWGNEGLALGPRGLLEWGVLDAQWFGLAQRRERLFALLDTGNWASRAPVLLEPEGLRGDSPPSRAAWPQPPGTLAGGARGGGGARGSGSGADRIAAPEIAAPLTHGGHPGSNAPGRRKEDDENLVAGPLLSNSGGHGWRTGAEEAAGNHYVVEQVAATLTNSGKRQRYDETYVPEVAEPITAHNARNATHAGNNARPRNVVACFDRSQVTSSENRSACGPELAALAAQAKPPTVATVELDDASSSAEVRRLTPTECERLMGMPDGYTRIPYRPRRRRRVLPASDTVRYAALGNSIATTQLAWIGRKLQEVLSHAQTHDRVRVQAGRRARRTDRQPHRPA